MSSVIEILLHEFALKLRICLFAAEEKADLPSIGIELHKKVSLCHHGRKITDAGHISPGLPDRTHAAGNNKVRHSRSHDRDVCCRGDAAPERVRSGRHDQVVLVLQKVIYDHIALFLRPVRDLVVDLHLIAEQFIEAVPESL